MVAPRYTEIKIHFRTLAALRAKAEGDFESIARPSEDFMWFWVAFGEETLQNLLSCAVEGETLDDTIYRLCKSAEARQ